MLTSVARSQGLSVLLVDQNIRLLDGQCDRTYVMRDGLAEPLTDDLSLESTGATYF